ncbi:hypothetical protein HK414_24290 [Ramlibacter terrae]|uniref:DUF91 domain-containing protein n=1 Tax=Ramlibacter terrae TaxID=2732511 RepID=A0ABX6P7B2_9BURK|nr:hypothetical protein HK414_24290 [Ramlibacter terrae]
MPLFILKSAPTPSLHTVDVESFGALKVRERDHIQQALKQAPECIEEGLLVLTEEFSEWEGANRRIDLLCPDLHLNLVVVELKRTDDGGHMELQAVRYAAMVSAMTFDKAVATHAKFLRREGIEEDAEQRIRDFLGNPDDDLELTDNLRIILLAADFSKEVTSTVLWLIERGVDIRCMRMIPARIAGEIVVDIHQIIPLPLAEEYQIAIREKIQRRERAEAAGRDFTKYEIQTSEGLKTGLPKRRFMLELISEAVRLGVTPQQIINAAPSRQSNMFAEAEGTLSGAAAMALLPTKDPKRYFCEDGLAFHAGGKTYVLSKMWGESTELVAEAVTGLLPPAR